MDTAKMAYPFGRCAGCGKEFNSELRNEYEIIYCPWCGIKVDDIFSITDNIMETIRKNDIFCEDCGTRIYERSGNGGRWLNDGKNGPGVCSGPCERELCGRCGEWDDEGCCPMCSLPCDLCPKENCAKSHEACTNPCATCPGDIKWCTDNTDVRKECEEYLVFLKQLGYRECLCGYVGDDFNRRDVNETDTVLSVGQVDIWMCPECGKEVAETKEVNHEQNQNREGLVESQF